MSNIICTICARGGSKGVPGKNIRNLSGKPLICHTIELALEVEFFSKIVVSSDCDHILSVAEAFDAVHTIERPDALASDSSGKFPAIKHAVQVMEDRYDKTFDYIFDLDATSPLRKKIDILSVWREIQLPKVDNVFSVTKSRKSPYFNMVALDSYGSPNLICASDDPIARRQDSPQCFDMNASIYAWTRRGFFNGSGLFNKGARVYVMPEERSIDIDTELDWQLVEFLVSSRERK